MVQHAAEWLRSGGVLPEGRTHAPEGRGSACAAAPFVRRPGAAPAPVQCLLFCSLSRSVLVLALSSSVSGESHRFKWRRDLQQTAECRPCQGLPPA